jgi:hypothetical protein
MAAPGEGKIPEAKVAVAVGLVAVTREVLRAILAMEVAAENAAPLFEASATVQLQSLTEREAFRCNMHHTLVREQFSLQQWSPP